MGQRIGNLLVGGLFFLVACAAAQPGSGQRFDPALYERHTISGNLLRLHWNLSQTEQGVTAEGYAENIGDSLTRVKYVRLTLVGYDGEGKEVARSKAVPPFPNTLLSADNISFPTEREIYGTFHISLPERRGAARFEVVANYLFDTYPQDEDTDRRQWKR